MFSYLRISLVLLLITLNSCKTDDPTWPKSAKRFITEFSFDVQPGVKATINDTDGLILITVLNKEITNLAPTIRLSAQATLTPEANVKQDFSKPVVYTVRAYNGLTKTYTVTVTREYNELVLAGNEDGFVYAYSAQTGKLQWKFQTDGPILSDVAVYDKLAFVGSSDKKFYAIDMATGLKKWSAELENIPQNSCPLIANGIVYVTDQKQLYAFEAKTGKEQWRTKGENGFGTSPVLANGFICVGGRSKLSAIELSKGEEKWAFNTSGNIIASPAVSGGLLFLCIDRSDSSGLRAIDTATGKEKWSGDTTVNQIRSSPTVSNGYIYVGSQNRKLFACDAIGGALKWGLSLDAPVVSSPQVIDSLLYLNTFAGTSAYVLGANLNNKPLLKWQFAQGEGLIDNNSPVYANGTLYTTGKAGFLVAVDAVTGKLALKFEAPAGKTFSNPCIVTHQGRVFQSGVSGAVQ